MEISFRTTVGLIFIGMGVIIVYAFPRSKDTDSPTTRNNSQWIKGAKCLIGVGILMVFTDPANWADIKSLNNSR